MKKSSFMFFKWARLGVHGIFAHPLRLIALVFLSTFALALFGLSLTMALYDEDRARVESLYKYEETIIVENNAGADKDYIEEIYSDTEKRFTRLIFDDATVNWYRFYYGNYATQSENPDCLLAAPQKVIQADITVFKEAGISILGRKPEKKDEVMISRCMANTILKFGYYDEIASLEKYGDTLDSEHYDKTLRTEYSSLKKFVNAERKLLMKDHATGETFAATIVGVADYTCASEHYDGYEYVGSLYDAIYVSEEYILSYGDLGAFYMISARATSTSQAGKIISFCNKNGLLLEAQSLVEVEGYGEMIKKFQTGFMWGSLVFAIFAAMLIYQFISLSIKQRLKEIGILRAIGATPADVLGIFFSESFILSFVYVLLAVPTVLLGSWGMNTALENLFLIHVSVLNFHIAVPFAILALSVLITAAASFIPIFRAAKKPPVEYIRENEI